MKLTSRQREVFEFVKRFMDNFNYMPTTRDISDHFQFGQTAAVGHLKALQAKGYIERTAKKARAMKLTRAL